MERLTVENALTQLTLTKSPFIELLNNNSISIEIYKPKKIDMQTPHDRDEVYIIISGSGNFTLDTTSQPFETGEVIFVPKGVKHHFTNFTEDFSTWVIFIN